VTELRRIKSVETQPYRLAVTWDDGTRTTVDLSQDILQNGSVFAPLHKREIFARVQIDPRRRVLQWLDTDGSTLVDIDADALFELGKEQRQPAAA
jgi:hypothetical protein